ncbi:MAG: Stress responsive alpha-beta barrel protein [Phycisphaerales bacterium]|nr:Stress responsive alpha-beta barrel protein [Phycisphaerales bacterium]
MNTRTIIVVAALALSFLTAAPARVIAADAPANQGKKMLYHVVAIKFKPEAKPEQIKAVEMAFGELKTKIPGITSLNWGTNVSPEQKNKGLTHCFVLTFATEKDRDAYLPHPEHNAFGKVLGPIMADVLVIDFWSQE